MSAEHKEDELQRMLALKRHETPPTPFFKGFPDKVIAGLDAPDPAASLPWWKRLGHDIDGKPVLVCASGIIVVGLLALGMIASRRFEPPKKRSLPADDSTRMIVTPPAHLLADQGTELSPTTAPKEIPRIGEPMVVPGRSPFGEIRFGPDRTGHQGTGAPQSAAPK